MIKRRVKKKDKLPDLIRAYDLFLEDRRRVLERLQKGKRKNCEYYIYKFSCRLVGCKNCCMFCGNSSCAYWDNCSYFYEVLMGR